MIKKYFRGSLIFTAAALALAVVVGYGYGGLTMAITYLLSALILAVLEVTVSLDNAVVNATILKDMDARWRHNFITWGMAIAVFGMRLIFPLAIVSIAGGVNPVSAVKIAIFDPQQYETVLKSVHMQIMAFGGTFLFLVFTSHFIDREKEEHWVSGIEPLLSRIGKHSTAKLLIPVVVVLLFGQVVSNSQAFITSAMWGTVVYLAVDGLGDLFDVEDAATQVARAGIASFLYLEVLDASFSFDGVIAAFAITNNFIIIMLGLSIGAMFVRSLTIMLVEKRTLATLRHLENGAFWGIGWLVVTMYLSVVHIELGEAAVAGGAALAIAAAAWHSTIANKRDTRRASKP